MAIDGILEDMTSIILNFKGALLRKLPTDGGVGLQTGKNHYEGH